MAWLQTGDQALLRKINLASVLSFIQSEAPVSRIFLANKTQLNKSTISSLVAELIERGLVYETGLNPSGGGRPATHLELNPDGGRIIGVELGVEAILGSCTDWRGRILARSQRAVLPDANQEHTLAALLDLIDELSASASLPGRVAGSGSDTAPSPGPGPGPGPGSGTRLLGIGMTVPGMVDLGQDRLIFSPNLRWRNLPLADMVEQRLGVPVWVDNDANASALGERLFGVARKASNFIFISAGVGVGGGLFLNGELYRGAGGFAGEIGHTSLGVGSQQPCRCGNIGCWENSTNQYSLIERMRARLEVGRPSLLAAAVPLTLEAIAAAGKHGDPQAIEAIRETGQVLGLKIANLINILNPELVVIGGAMSAAGEHLLPAIQSVVHQRALPECQRDLNILLSAFGPDAGVVGAAALVVKSILTDPTQVVKVRG